MQKDRFPRRVPGAKGQPSRASARGPIGLVGKTGAKGQRGVRGAQGKAGPAGASLTAARITGADRVELLSVVQMQIDNIHRELDAQTHRSGQLEVLITRVENQLRELIALSKWLQSDGGRRPTPGAGVPPKISH
jgi:hypothetical protein